MKVPCNVVHWYLVPAISSELAYQLGRLKVSQAKVAEILGLTPAAVSQYMKSKRGRKIELVGEGKKEVCSLAKKISRGRLEQDELLQAVCKLCVSVRRTNSIRFTDPVVKKKYGELFNANKKNMGVSCQ